MMNVTVSTLILCLSAALAADLPSAPVGPTASEKAEIEKLIGKLSSDDFQVRESAHQALAKYEGKAYRLLLAAESTTSDAETRHRCGLLIPEARTANLNDRLAAFLADKKGEYSHDLPGLSQFLEATKDTLAARELFANIVKEPATQKLLAIIESDPDSLPQAVHARALELQNRQVPRPPPPPPGLVVNPPVFKPVVRAFTPATPTEILSLFFVDSLTKNASDDGKFAGRRTGNGLTIFLNQPTFRNLLIKNAPNDKPVAATDEQSQLARAILRGWFESRKDVYDINIAISYSVQFGMPDVAINNAMKQLARKDQPASLRGSAIAALGRFAKDENTMPQLERLLKDETLAGNRVEHENDEKGRLISHTYPIQSRDIALAMILQSKGLKPADYGMRVFSQTDSMKFYASNYWFKTDDDRTAAFEKFEQEQKKSKSVKPEK